METSLDKIINEVLKENNKHWLTESQADYNIGEGRVPITRKDIHDVVKKLPIHIMGVSNIKTEITNEGIVKVTPNSEEESVLIYEQDDDVVTSFQFIKKSDLPLYARQKSDELIKREEKFGLKVDHISNLIDWENSCITMQFHRHEGIFKEHKYSAITFYSSFSFLKLNNIPTWKK